MKKLFVRIAIFAEGVFKLCGWCILGGFCGGLFWWCLRFGWRAGVNLFNP